MRDRMGRPLLGEMVVMFSTDIFGPLSFVFSFPSGIVILFSESDLFMVLNCEEFLVLFWFGFVE